MIVSRRFALTLFSGAALSAAPLVALAAGSGSRRLAFEHIHTGERLAATYRTETGYDREALGDIAHVLRDWRTGEVMEMDPALLDQLFEVQAKLGHGGAVRVISGYRSPKTNTALAGAGRGVAKRSLHMQGRAIDIALPGIRTPDLRDAALALKSGGVGTYSRSGFVHLDTGRVRRWGS